MKIFRSVTFSKDIVMGSNTYLSIGKILPFRTNYIISNNKDIQNINKLFIVDYTNVAIPHNHTNSHKDANSQFIDAVFKGKVIFVTNINSKN